MIASTISTIGGGLDRCLGAELRWADFLASR
jgi:hypothetical protein